MKLDMSPKAVTRRLRRVSELVRVCRALAGPRRRQEQSKMRNQKSKVSENRHGSHRRHRHPGLRRAVLAGHAIKNQKSKIAP